MYICTCTYINSAYTFPGVIHTRVLLSQTKTQAHHDSHACTCMYYTRIIPAYNINMINTYTDTCDVPITYIMQPILSYRMRYHLYLAHLSIMCVISIRINSEPINAGRWDTRNIYIYVILSGDDIVYAGDTCTVRDTCLSVSTYIHIHVLNHMHCVYTRL